MLEYAFYYFTLLVSGTLLFISSVYTLVRIYKTSKSRFPLTLALFTLLAGVNQITGFVMGMSKVKANNGEKYENMGLWTFCQFIFSILPL